MANIQPNAAYAAFVHGICNQWSYPMRTTPDLEELLHPLEEEIARDFLPALREEKSQMKSENYWPYLQDWEDSYS